MTMMMSPKSVIEKAKDLLSFGTNWKPNLHPSTPAGALSVADASAVARNLLTGPKAYEWERLQRITEALRPDRAIPNLGIQIPADAPAAMWALARKSQANFLPLVVNTFSQVMKVENYIASDSSETSPAWDYWQRNRMDARQTGIHQSLLKYGVSYGKTLPGTRTNGPVMKCVSPLDMTAVYEDPINDEWPLFALQIDRRLIYLYDEVAEYVLGIENIPTSSYGYPHWQNISDLAFIQATPHGAGVPPVVRFQDKMLLEGEEQFGIVEPLMNIQERIYETNFGMMVAQYFSAFRQRYILGWFPETEQEQLRATAAEVWLFKDPDVKVGQFEETSPDYYVAAKRDAMQDLASIAQIPQQNLGVDGIANISAEALTALEEGKTRRVDEITTCVGDSWKQWMRLCCHLDGDEEGASDFNAEIKWKDATARAYAATIDALGKIGQMLGVPDELLWEDIPGWDNQKVARAKSLRGEADELESLYLQSAQGAPAVGRGIQAEQAADPDAQPGQ